MMSKLTLYSRRDCCLCAEMKIVIAQVAATIPVELVEVDVDASAELRQRFGDQVPVLFIDGRKAFKYRVTSSDLRQKLSQKGPFLGRWARTVGKESS